MKSQAVTPEHIGKCHRFATGDGRDVWGVESESTVGIDGRPLEYCVYLDINSCSCPAFHMSKGLTCKHILWCRAAQAEERAAFQAIDAEIDTQEQTLHKLSVNGRAPSQAVAQRILCAPHTPVVKDISTSQITANRGFSLLR